MDKKFQVNVAYLNFIKLKKTTTMHELKMQQVRVFNYLLQHVNSVILFLMDLK